MTQRSGPRASSSKTATKVAGVASIGLLSLLLNPFFIGSVVAVAALVSGANRKASR